MTYASDAIDWKSRKAKRATSARMFEAMAAVNPPPPARNAIFLPGPECLCVEEALKVGLISRKATRIVAAENNPSLFPAMRDKLDALRFQRQPRTLIGEIETFDGDEFPSGVDLAYLDLCGHLDTGMARWMHDILSPRLAVGALVAVTTICDGKYRGNEMMKRTRVHFEETPPAAVTEVQARVPLIGASREMRSEQALGICLVLCTLRRWNVEVSALAPYTDGRRKMGKSIFRIVSESADQWWPGIEDVIRYTDWLSFDQFISLEGHRKRVEAKARGLATKAERAAYLRELDMKLERLNAEALAVRRERDGMLTGHKSRLGAAGLMAGHDRGAVA